MRKCAMVLASVSVLALAASAQATLLSYEGFSYTTGSEMGGATGGTGWSTSGGMGGNGGWWYDTDFSSSPDATSPTNKMIGAGGLTYNGLQTSGNAMQRDPAGGNYPFVRNTASDISGYASDLWVSALINTTGAGGSSFLFLGEFGKGFGFSGNNIYLGNRAATNVQAAFTPGSTTHLFVMEIAQSTGNAQLWVDPSNLTSLGTPNLTYDFGSTTYTYEISADVNSAPSFFDEIRLGTTQADVLPVPEPMSVGLISISAMGLLSRRRARKG